MIFFYFNQSREQCAVYRFNTSVQYGYFKKKYFLLLYNYYTGILSASPLVWYIFTYTMLNAIKCRTYFLINLSKREFSALNFSHYCVIIATLILLNAPFCWTRVCVCVCILFGHVNNTTKSLSLLLHKRQYTPRFIGEWWNI